MKITVNGETRLIEATTLASAMIELGYGEVRVATAVNECFVASTAREGKVLSDGDRIEILAPMQGG